MSFVERQPSYRDQGYGNQRVPLPVEHSIFAECVLAPNITGPELSLLTALPSLRLVLCNREAVPHLLVNRRRLPVAIAANGRGEFRCCACCERMVAS